MEPRVARGAAIVWVLLALAACGRPRTFAVLLPEPDGSVGAIELSGEQGTRALDRAGLAVSFDAEEDPSAIEDEEIRERFGGALDAAPADPARFALHFHSDSTRLTRSSRDVVAKVLASTRDRVVAEVTVIGRTDRSGPRDYNDRLALARARQIARELVRAGVAEDRIEIISLGEAQPIVETRDGVHEPKNRRVDVIVR